MLLLAAWSTNGWLPSGHAMRMALDLGLHRALEKLAEGGVKRRSEEEERDLGAYIHPIVETTSALHACTTMKVKGHPDITDISSY